MIDIEQKTGKYGECDVVDSDLTRTRRTDRAMDDSWIRAFLHRAPYASIAVVDGNQPYINTKTFVYDETEHAIYLHGARQGRFRTCVDNSDRVCLTVTEMGRLLPADTAQEFSVEYGSVVVFGRITVITDPIQGHRALQMLLDKYFGHLKPGTDYAGLTQKHVAATTVYRIDIDIERWSGKRKKEAEDFPGAFVFESIDYGDS